MVATKADLPSDGSRVITDVEGKEIAVFRVDGEFYGVLNYCVHQAGPLCEGRLTDDVDVGDDGWSWEKTREGKVISCPWHSWKFDVTTGANVDDDSYAVPVFDVEVEDGDVYVVL